MLVEPNRDGQLIEKWFQLVSVTRSLGREFLKLIKWHRSEGTRRPVYNKIKVNSLVPIPPK